MTDNFKQEAYLFTKQISTSSLKREYDNIIQSFHGKGSKSIYDQMSMAKGNQFLTYFIVESHKTEMFEKLNMIIPELDEHERKILGRCHSFLLYLNDELCKDLTDRYPNAKKVFTPYSQIVTKTKLQCIDDIVLELDVSKLKNAFKKTAAYKYIIGFKDIKIDIKKLPESHLVGFCFTLAKEFSSLSKSTEQILMQINDPKNRGLIKLMLCIASIRYMLENLNQLIYQKFRNDNLYLIDENSIITYTEKSNMLGSVTSVLTQTSGDGFLTECFDFVLFKGKDKEMKLLKVEGIEMTFDKEEGDMMQFTLRNTNEELNPLYSTITR